MKYLILLTFVFMTSSLMAAQNELGLGAMLGNPAGLNGKYWLSDEVAIDGGIALSWGQHSDVSLHSDYLLHNMGAFFFDEVHPLDLYYGIGGRMEFGDDLELGVRVPVGLAHRFTDQPADIFAEIAPILDFIGRIGVEIHFAVGGRYYF